MIRGSLHRRSSGFPAEFIWKGILKLVRPVWETRLLVILKPFRNCTRAMFKASTKTTFFQVSRVANWIDGIKSTENQIRNFLDLVEEAKVF
jgi:hypothetical protein